jgi:hypothetical protein
VFFEFLVTRNAGEVGIEAGAATGFTTMRTNSSVFHMSVRALARCAPSVYVKSFSSWQPMLTYFFGPTRDKVKGFAVTRLTVVLELSTLQKCLFMDFE